jgi:hypothetical protein
MPAPIPAHVALRTELRKSIEDALSIAERLEKVIAIKPRANSGGFHGKVDHSQPPWNAPVANAIMDLHAQSRDAEGCLRIALKLPKRPRGGSSDNTRVALENVLRLSEGADDASVRENIRWLKGWRRRALIALEVTEAPRKLPRLKGEPERRCPFCKQRTLRMLPLKGVIWCLDKECTDNQDRRPEAQLKYSEIMKDLVLVWQDNLVGLP